MLRSCSESSLTVTAFSAETSRKSQHYHSLGLDHPADHVLPIMCPDAAVAAAAAARARIEGAVWYADVGNQHCVRVREGREVLATVDLNRGAFACALSRGGDSHLLVVGQTWGGPVVLVTPEAMAVGSRTTSRFPNGWRSPQTARRWSVPSRTPTGLPLLERGRRRRGRWASDRHRWGWGGWRGRRSPVRDLS
jgi:hypothetical protein